ncbi:hypothetical protein CORC01_06238 [Colletotrichum orchidophilum]|uniref:C6 zinc finger domain-containing protein n=1 Tax=Colletotrichum orchidophilum TaxID=1209926 RepID=A0A1G4BAL5_9PEZI|nr:uncharacterized protein CORC01_06238 [Colletotrichum orchidophilum]OHE98447.1 hypothetical protein CORC01_06238 [Colletotrichum orchidophilum]
MVSLAKPQEGHSRVEESRGKRDAHKPRKAFLSTSQKRRSSGYPASWTSRWKHRPHPPPTRHQSQSQDSSPGPVVLGRKDSSQKLLDSEEEPELVLSKCIQVGPEVLSVNRFHANYAAQASILIFSRLPEYYDIDLSDASHARHATHAVALASASRSLHQSGLMVEARRHYGKAISTLNQALQDPVAVRDDANLVTLFLFGMFEVINGKRGTSTIDLQENVFPHGAGGLQLFKFRAHHGLTNEVDKACFTFFCHAALMEMFIQRDHLTPLWSMLEEMETPWGKGPVLEPLVRQVVDFKKAFDFKVQVQSNSSTFNDSPPEDLLELVRSGIDLSSDLEAAIAFLGISGASTCFGQQQKVFNGLFSLSSESSVAIARSHYRSLRVYLLERTIELRNILKESCEHVAISLGLMPSWSDGVSVVRDVIEDIRIVFGLEGKKETPTGGLAYRTMTMFWPMVMIRTSCFAGPHNGRWVAERMLELTSESGFGLGVEAARA